MVRAFKLPEASKLYNVSVQTIKEAIEAGVIPTAQLVPNRKILWVREKDMDDFINSRFEETKRARGKYE